MSALSKINLLSRSTPALHEKQPSGGIFKFLVGCGNKVQALVGIHAAPLLAVETLEFALPPSRGSDGHRGRQSESGLRRQREQEGSWGSLRRCYRIVTPQTAESSLAATGYAPAPLDSCSKSL